jgi:hypothetical protein
MNKIKGLARPTSRFPHRSGLSLNSDAIMFVRMRHLSAGLYYVDQQAVPR